MNALLRMVPVSVATLLVLSPAALAKDEVSKRLEAQCAWLVETRKAQGSRDDAFGLVMQALDRQCTDEIGQSRSRGYKPGKRAETLAAEIETLRAAIEPQPRKDAPAPKKDAKGKGKETATSEAPADQVTGTWHQEPDKEADAFVKRRLELVLEGKKVSGTLFEETWFKAPREWVESSCEGNPVFRMVTSADVKGTLKDRKLGLKREVPKVIACTCGARCAPDKRSRGWSFTLSRDGGVLSSEDIVYTREGAEPRLASAGDGGKVGSTVGPESFVGVWESAPFEDGNAKKVVRFELSAGGKGFVGSYSERVEQALPLANWKDRFCNGADRFDFVHVFDVEGKPRGGLEAEVGFAKGKVLSCSCPSKCITPKRRGITIRLTPDGEGLELGDVLLRRP